TEIYTLSLHDARPSLEDKITKISWAMHWSIVADNFLHSFCNTINTPLGGSHENGFKQALVKGLKNFGEIIGNKKAANINTDDVRSEEHTSELQSRENL